MESQLIKIATSQGIWATLSVFLICYILKTQEKRENEYQSIIKNLTQKFNIVQDMDRNIKGMEKDLGKMNFK